MNDSNTPELPSNVITLRADSEAPIKALEDELAANFHLAEAALARELGTGGVSYYSAKLDLLVSIGLSPMLGLGPILGGDQHTLVYPVMTYGPAGIDNADNALSQLVSQAAKLLNVNALYTESDTADTLTVVVRDYGAVECRLPGVVAHKLSISIDVGPDIFAMIWADKQAERNAVLAMLETPDNLH